MNSLWFMGIFFWDVPQNDINKPVRAITAFVVRKAWEWFWGEQNEPVLEKQRLEFKSWAHDQGHCTGNTSYRILLMFFNSSRSRMLHSRPARTSESIILMFLWAKNTWFIILLFVLLFSPQPSIALLVCPFRSSLHKYLSLRVSIYVSWFCHYSDPILEREESILKLAVS